MKTPGNNEMKPIEENRTILMRLALWQLRHRGHGGRRSRIVVGLVGIGAALGLVGGAAFAYWTVSGSGSGQAQSASVTNLTISASTNAATNLLYPGANGDAVLSISNPNSFPVTITALQLPTNTTYADGYSDNTLTTPKGGCAASTPSDVIWNYSTLMSGSSHTLHTSLTVSGGATLIVTMTNDVSMTTSAPLACASTFFKMPALMSVTATSDTAAGTASPATDFWNS